MGLHTTGMAWTLFKSLAKTLLHRIRASYTNKRGIPFCSFYNLLDMSFKQVFKWFIHITIL